MPVTIYDVAREAGVSMATVSRVVNGNPNVKPSTRKKVLRVIEELGYRPNAVARGLASKKTTTIGVVLPDISSIFFAELTRGIDDIANMYHYNIILSSSDQNLDKEIKLINNLLEKQVDGLLYIGGALTEEHQKVFASAQVPIVLVATTDPKKKLPSVRIDLEKATYEATEYLIKKGHKRIGFVCGLQKSPLMKARFQGYKQALADYQIPFDDQLVQEIQPVYEMALEATKKFLKLKEAPTAILSANDEMAVAVVNSLQDEGVKVPDEVEVIGFNNTRLSLMCRPMLTSVVQPMYDIGAVSMRLLTKLIHDEEVQETDVILPHRIEFRNSTK